MISHPIFTRDVGYLAAIAELPVAAHIANHPDGAIAVVPPGSATVDAALRVERAGAAALVIDPRFVSAEELAALGRDVRVPVVISRPRVRPDVAVPAMDASGSARAVVAEAAATSADRLGVVGDALGWSRLLAGGALRLVAHETTAEGLIALLERGDVPVSLTFSLARTGAPVIRAHTIGHERAEVTVDDGALVQRVETHDANGARTAPARFESVPRLDLRRAIEALRTAQNPSDLHECAADLALAEQLLGG